MSTGVIDGNVLAIQIVQRTLTPVAVAANTTAEQTFNVPGLRATDFIAAFVKPTVTAGVGVVNYRVAAKDTLAATFVNATGGAITPPAEVYTAFVLRPDGVIYGAVQ